MTGAAWVVGVAPDLPRRRHRTVERALEGVEAEVELAGRTAFGALVERALAAPATGVAVAGGDADLAALAEAVIDAGAGDDLRVGLIPLSGSSLLRMFGLPHRSGPAEHLRTAGEYRTDLVRLSTTAGTRLVAAAAGLGIAAGAPGRLRRRGAAVEVTARTPLRTLVHRARGALIANSQFWGRANPAPRAMVVDGRFDLQLLLGRRTRSLVGAMRTGRHGARRDVLRTAVSAVAIHTDAPWPVAADGEAAGSTPVEASVVEAAIRLAI